MIGVHADNYWASITMSSDGTHLAALDWSAYLFTSSDSGVQWVGSTLPGKYSPSTVVSSSDGTKLAVSFPGTGLTTSADRGAT